MPRCARAGLVDSVSRWGLHPTVFPKSGCARLLARPGAWYPALPGDEVLFGRPDQRGHEHGNGRYPLYRCRHGTAWRAGESRADTQPHRARHRHAERHPRLSRLDGIEAAARFPAVLLRVGARAAALRTCRCGGGAMNTQRRLDRFEVEPTRQRRSCRWPCGDPQSGDFRFCCSPTADGRPYCAAHCSIAYWTPSAPAHRPETFPVRSTLPRNRSMRRAPRPRPPGA
jgi:hypothetical protein